MGYGTLGKYDYNIIGNIEGLDITYFCNEKSEIKDETIHIQKIYKYSTKRGLLKFWSYLKTQSMLFRSIAKHKGSTAHFQWLKMPYFDFMLLKILKKRGIRLVLTVHNILPHNSGDKYKFIYKKIYNELDDIIVHASNTKQELCDIFGIFPNKIHVIPHGIFMMEGVNDLETEKLKQAFIKKNQLEKKVVFGVLGRINKYKGIHLIAETWHSLDSSSKEKMHLLIAGQGDSDVLNELDKLHNTTIINRALDDNEFNAFLQLSDYILLPYFKISQSGVLLTALSEKKRVIVSNKGGLTEPFKFGKIGYILEELTVAHLHKVLAEAVLENNNHPKENVWQAIFDYYDWKNIGRMTKKLYLQ